MNDQNLSYFSLPKSADRGNADRVGYVFLKDGRLAVALADGVGKSASGADAASIAISTVLEQVETESIEAIFANAQTKIAHAAASAGTSNWSTTLTVCLITDNRAVIGHVGDSRVYHLRGKGLQTRTRDQTEVQALIEEGIISKERALRYPRRNVLISALSSDITYELYQQDFELLTGDRLLLVSDGIYKRLSRAEIISISSESSSVEIFIEKLKLEIIEKGLIDDSTVICVQIS